MVKCLSRKSVKNPSFFFRESSDWAGVVDGKKRDQRQHLLNSMLFWIASQGNQNRVNGKNQMHWHSYKFQLPTTVEHDPANNRHSITMAQSIERCHVHVEALSGYVQTSPDGPSLMIRPANIDQECSGIQDVSQDLELAKQIFFAV
jgi:hypothetical protein